MTTTSTTAGREELLKVDSVGRVRTPREQREAILDEFERSGLPGTRFAKRHGIKYGTFATWVQKRRRQREVAVVSDQAKASGLAPETHSLRLAEVVLQTANPSAPPQPLRITLPNGALLELSHPSQVPLAAQLLQALQLQTGHSSC